MSLIQRISDLSSRVANEIKSVRSELTTHANDETSVHGISNTANLVYTNDTRLSNARTPTAHAATHASGGSDPVTPAAIGAATASHNHSGVYAPASHTSDTTSVHGISNTANLVYTSDSRLSNARTPTSHASTHASGGSDPITPGSIGAATSGHSHVVSSLSGEVSNGQLPRRLRQHVGGQIGSYTDWNDVNESGWYSATGLANSPDGSGAWFFGEVIAHNTVWVSQTLTKFTGNSPSNELQFRRQLNNGTWSDWYRIYDTQDELDTRYARIGVSETGTVPTGSVSMYIFTDVPAGWVNLDGRALPTGGIYADLFALIGYSYGGSGSVFYVPDMSSRFPIGATSASGYLPGDTGGSATASLTLPNLPPHTHIMTHSHGMTHSHNMNHGHAAVKNNTAGASITTFQAGANNANNVNTGSGSPVLDYNGNTANYTGNTNNFTGTTGSAGSGASFDVLNPYFGVTFMIKL